VTLDASKDQGGRRVRSVSMDYPRDPDGDGFSRWVFFLGRGCKTSHA
jgi:hypothetical protein